MQLLTQDKFQPPRPSVHHLGVNRYPSRTFSSMTMPVIMAVPSVNRPTLPVNRSRRKSATIVGKQCQGQKQRPIGIPVVLHISPVPDDIAENWENATFQAYDIQTVLRIQISRRKSRGYLEMEPRAPIPRRNMSRLRNSSVQTRDPKEQLLANPTSKRTEKQ